MLDVRVSQHVLTDIKSGRCYAFSKVMISSISFLQTESDLKDEEAMLAW